MVSKREFVREWVKALRSGKYKQGKGRLARAVEGSQTEHCCLGVACDVGFRLGVPEALNDLMSDGTLPGAWLGKILGTKSSDPTVTCSGRKDCLSMQNDQHGRTFSQIADGIERDLA